MILIYSIFFYNLASHSNIPDNHLQLLLQSWNAVAFIIVVAASHSSRFMCVYVICCTKVLMTIKKISLNFPYSTIDQ